MKGMYIVSIVWGILMAIFVQGCSSQQDSEPFPRISAISSVAPKAEIRQYQAEYHGLTLSDNYHWLRDQSYPEVDDQAVIDYLQAENKYFDDFLAPHAKLVDTLFEEFKGRVEESDESVPWQENGYEYRWFYRKGEDYKTWARRKLGSVQEEIFLDEAKLSEGQEYFSLDDWQISPDNKLLAYSVDTDGSERTVIKIKNLATDAYLDDVLINAAGELAFSLDSQSIVYTLLEEEKWRTKSVSVHKLGEPQSQDKVLISEADDTFNLGFRLTSSQQYFVVTARNYEQTEVSVFDAKDLSQKPMQLNSREQNFLLTVDHGNGYFYMLSNDTHVNFRLSKTKDSMPGYSHWQTVVAGNQSHYLTDLKVFDNFIALSQTIQGLESISIYPDASKPYEIEFPEDVAHVSIGNNPEFKQTHLRINYESMITPVSVFDYDLTAKSLLLQKASTIPSGYDKDQYQTKRLMAKARDGVQVPVTLVYKKGFRQDASQPVFLYGYGAYGTALPPYFSTLRLSLLDRGFAYAFAHVRGGMSWVTNGI
ncbi:S9 family peptidase [Paraglaciecola aquimarina]|uniref:S9 family peptidase n=1 Tax=Paraglaciecola aquimarina TaxID=1235557 RepID=A0ABU3SW70_9ALTE|nr:S9 family peptidase [Paraglaciecola aquimarina]MDU0354256.1 S9 family peptidase [Paraglaciecola aquimarina]